MKIDVIYVDMDGVIADFERRYIELFDVSPQVTRDNKEFGGYFDKFIADGNFANLELMPDARVLLNFLDSLPVPKEILSSTASQKRYDAIAPQKARWLTTHNIDYKRNFVPGKQHKYKFATPNSIIIDDTLSVIEDWNRAGGIGIYHKNAETTLAELSQLMLQVA